MQSKSYHTRIHYCYIFLRFKANSKYGYQHIVLRLDILLHQMLLNTC